MAGDRVRPSRSSRERRARWPGVVIVACLLATTPASAQLPSGSWMIGADAGLDLWYHGLALAGFQGTGGEVLYDPGYPAYVAGAREAMGLPPTPLEESARRLGARLQADPAFEVFHFLPLYFPGVGRQSMLAALRVVAETEGETPIIADPSARFGATALAGVLNRPDQRDLLREFLDQLDLEWDAFFQRFHREQVERLAPLAREVQTVWAARVGPRLVSFLERYSLDRGWIYLSRPLGWEGRILAGDPSNPWDNQVAVGYREDALQGGVQSLVSEVVIRAVRELCYPAVREAMERVGPEVTNPRGGAQVSSVAAIRCGAMILDRHLPEFSAPYREEAMTRGGAGAAGSTGEAFERRFELTPDLEQALEAVVLAIG